MESFFGFFAAQREGILVFLLVLAVVTLLVQWFSWILGWGRFKGPRTTQSSSSLRYIFVEFLTKIIDQFRHLLALLVVLIFAAALGYAMIESQQGIPGDANGTDQLKEVLTIIMSTLGGLVGLILGYYFGESSVASAVEAVAQDQNGSEHSEEAEVQETPEATSIETAPLPPPGARGDDEEGR